MTKRIFIAINLPEKIKQEILAWQRKHADLNVRWTKCDNFHITLAFIGSVDGGIVKKIVDALAEIGGHFPPFEITLERIGPGPSAANPRMIWIAAAANATLEELNRWTDNALVKNQIPYEDTHAFHPHITPARSSGAELKGKNFAENLNLRFKAESVDIMESRLSSYGADYTLLRKIIFKKR